MTKAWWQINPPKCAKEALESGPICWPLTPEEADQRGVPYVIWFDWMPASPWKGYFDEDPLPDRQAVCIFRQLSFDFSGVTA